MSRNRRVVKATPAEVWHVLADGWLYPLWVVGSDRMRAVDRDWPVPGSRLHHSVGAWPFLINDTTIVQAAVPERRLHLRARGWPLGVADVSIELSAVADGTEVVLEEDAVGGPGRLVPAPVRSPLLWWRNTEVLNRLAVVVEGRAFTRRTGRPGHVE